MKKINFSGYFGLCQSCGKEFPVMATEKELSSDIWYRCPACGFDHHLSEYFGSE